MEELLLRVENNDLEGLQKILQKTGSLISMLDCSNCSLLHAAVVYASFDCLNELLLHVITKQEIRVSGAESTKSWINIKNNEGNSALLFAVMNGSLVTTTQEIIDLLVRYHADLNTKNIYGKDAAHIAAEKDFAHVIAYLDNLNISLNRQNSSRDTPLHVAIDMNSYKSVGLLLTLRIEKNKQNADLRTALHIAAKNNNGKIARLLLLKGYDKSIKDSGGKLPEELCTDPEIKKLFKASGTLEVMGCRQILADGEKKNYWPFFTMSSLMLTVFILNSVFLDNCEVYIDGTAFPYMIGALIFFTVGLMIILIFRDPGYLMPGSRLGLSVFIYVEII